MPKCNNTKVEYDRFLSLLCANIVEWLSVLVQRRVPMLQVYWRNQNTLKIEQRTLNTVNDLVMVTSRGWSIGSADGEGLSGSQPDSLI